MDFSKLDEIFSKSDKIVITTHLIPDGDAIGSVLGLYYFLKYQGKSPQVINHSPTPFNLSFLDREKVISVFSEDKEKNHEAIITADVVCILDTNEYSRTKSMEASINEAKGQIICIDHHQGLDESKYDFAISDTSYPATAQLLYDYMNSSNAKIIDSRIAESLYIGILTDTGSFRYPRTTSETFRICADLIDKGADPVKIYDEIYGSNSINKVKLLAKFIDSLDFYENRKMGVGLVTARDFDEFDADVTDIEGFSSIIMSIRNVELGVLLIELPHSIKVSFRSKGDIMANELANIYGGGGHKNAAGASLPKQDIFLLKQKILPIAKKYLN